MNNAAILEMLKGGDRRSIGRSNEVVELVLAEPALFEAVFSGMSAGDAVLRMRCADAVEKISARRPELLQAHTSQLIELAANSRQQEVRWHAAQMFSRLDLDSSERQVVVEILLSYLEDKSSIVKTFAMQALGDIAAGDATYRPQVIELLENLVESGTPAMQARGRRLLKMLKPKDSSSSPWRADFQEISTVLDRYSELKSHLFVCVLSVDKQFLRHQSSRSSEQYCTCPYWASRFPHPSAALRVLYLPPRCRYGCQSASEQPISTSTGAQPCC